MPATTSDPGVTVQLVDVNRIRESPTNPRKTLGDITELAASIEDKGLLQPPLLRPYPGAAGTYELVFGWRRFRAAIKAGLTAIPAMVRDLDDRQVHEFQILENTQREKVPPLEEAEGYRLLIAEHGYTVEDLALKVHKSKSWIYGRLSLTKLHKNVRRAMAEGEISESVAAVLGTISPVELQTEALDEVLDEVLSTGGIATVEEAKKIVNDGYRLRLADAPFEKDDSDLIKKAGACTACLKRSGAQLELYDVKSPDVCTDRVCFAAKKAASWERKSAESAARGAKVLSEKQAGQLFAGGEQVRSSEYVDLDASHPDDPKKRTWRKLLGAELANPDAVVQAPTGKPRELLKMATAIELATVTGHAALVKPLKTRSSSAGKATTRAAEQQESWKKRDAAAARARGRRDAALEEAITAAAEVAMARPLAPKAWPAVALLAVRAFSTRATLVAKRRNGDLASLEKEARAGGEALARGLLVELLLTSTAVDTFHAYPPIAVEALLSFGVDVKAIEKRQAADAKAAAKGPAPRALPPDPVTAKGKRAAKASSPASRSHPQD